MLKDKIKILGAFGGKTQDTNNTCIQINNKIIIDAGNILNALGNEAIHLEHIFLTHSHLDHIVEIPFLIDHFFNKKDKPLNIYGLEGTINHLKDHIFNDDIWPDFSQINIIQKDKPSIIFHTLKVNEELTIDEVTLKPIKTNHTDSSCGYVITKENNSILFTSDTYKCDQIWNEINTNQTIKSMIIDVSFPSSFDYLSNTSKHLTPKKLHEELEKLQRKELVIYVNHLKPNHFDVISKEIKELDCLNGGKILIDGDIINLKTQKYESLHTDNTKNHVNQLIEIGNSLTSEKNIDVLLEKILLGAKNLSNADAGTLYLLNENNELEFKVVQTDSLNIKMGGSQGDITWDKLNLYDKNKKPNKQMVAVLCALEKKLINIEDVYFTEGFNFNGTKEFDKTTGYRSKSMLVVPMTNHEGEVIGVLQLLNKQDIYNNSIEFNQEDEKLIKSMSSQAAISIENTRLIKSLEDLLDSFIKTIANAIGEKSFYTGGHITRVAELASIMAEEIHKDKTVYKDINYSHEEFVEIQTAAWLHDIGKMTTPEYVIDKATKLETIYDRINTIRAKFEVAKRDMEIEYLKNSINLNKDEDKTAKDKLKIELEKMEDNLAFLSKINYGSFMQEEDKQRVRDIAKRKIILNGEKVNLLDENEVYNLCIQRGTLTDEEREVINNHVIVTYNMLNTLPFPKKLKRVPIIAASHHKKVGGGGYGASEIMDIPMTLEDKILAIADVFEALTANDRPYKKANSLNKSMTILAAMVKDNALDKELVKFFVDKKLHLKYGERHLKDEQMDEITVDFDSL